MKRSPLRRKKPMSRSRMKRKTPRRLSRPGADPAYVAWSHRQPCVGTHAFPGHICEGRAGQFVGAMEFSHDRNPIVDGVKQLTGAGRKEPDRRGVTKCSRLHRHWTEHTGPFEGWTDEQRATWMEDQIALQNASYLGEGYVFA